MSSEFQQMKNMAENPVDKSETKFVSSQFEYITDESAGSYNTSCDSVNIVYDTTPFSARWVNYGRSYIQIPLTIYNSAYAATNVVALKQSVLSLISGLQVTPTDGQSIINQGSSTHLDIYNNIKLMADSSKEQAEQLKSILVLAKDQGSSDYRVLPNDFYGYMNCSKEFSMTGASVTFDTSVNFSCTPSGTGTSGSFNTGLAYRKTKTMKNLDTGAFSILVQIPLRFLHDFFTKIDRPILGGNFRIQITMNTAAKMLISYTDLAISTQVVPTIKISNMTIDGYSTSARTRLFCNVVELPPKLLAEERIKLESGEPVTFKFRDYVVSKLQTAQTSDTISEVLSQSVVKPVRVFVVGFNAGRVFTGNLLQCANPVLRFTKVNLNINGQPLYKQPLETPIQQWKEFLRACAVKDCDDSKLAEKTYISYDDFEGLYRINAFDLSGVKSLLSSESTPVYLELVATRKDTTSCDYMAYIEKEMVCKMSLNGKNLKVLVSQ